MKVVPGERCGWCGVVWCGVVEVWCGVMVVWWCVVWRDVALRGVVLCCEVGV